MNTIDEQAVRDQLARAVAPLDPVAPPLDVLRASASRRRRIRYSVGGGLAAAAAAIAAVILVVVPGDGSKQVTIGKAPSAESLAAFAATQHGKHIAGPIESSSGFYGAFAVKKGVEVVRFIDGSWQQDGAVITKYGPGRWVSQLSDGGAVVPGRPSFAMRYVGGDVSYFGGVIYLANEGLGSRGWVPAHFGKCSNRELSCSYSGETQPYGHVVRGRFVSIHNDCTPYCAAGTDYRVTWQWDGMKRQFTVASERPIKQ
ncbi:MAG TPA: hypothetical protein VHD81_05910 [Mycobacteriales bacterium]|nr:hypothetical protein [Mycobacteriales bacterium]